MAKRGREVKHTYKLKHMDQWKKLTVQPEAKPIPKPETKNINQLWRWDTLEDINY